MPDDKDGAVQDAAIPENGDGKPAGENNDADLNLDDIYFGDDDETPPDKDDKGENKDGKSADGKKEGAEGKDPSKDVQQLLAEIEKLKGDKVNLNKALHEERQQKKKAAKADDADGDELTETQLRELMKEHHDDPEALFNLVQYMARTAAKKEKKAAVDEVEVAGRRKELDALVSQRTPEFSDPDSPLRKQVDSVRASLALENHPYSDFLALGANTYLALPEIMKAVYAKGKEDAVKEAVEANRTKGVDDAKPTPRGGAQGKVPDGKAAKDTNAVAKQLGMSASQAKIYQKLVSGRGGSVTVEG